MNWSLYLNFLAAMFAIVNPIGIWPVWSELTSDQTSKIRKRVAFLVILSSYFALLVFLFSGKFILEFFSIDLAVFKVAGGLLLLNTGMSMMKGSASQLTDRNEDGPSNMSIAKQRFRKIIVPIGIPALVGPGSITTVMLFSSKVGEATDYLWLAVIVFIAFFSLFIVFLSSRFFERKVDDIVFTIFTRLFGIMVVAIGMQFMLEGLGSVFPILLEGLSVLEKEGQMNQ